MKENKKNRKYIIICLSLWLVFCISLLVSYKEEWTVFINEPHIVYHEGINENGKTKFYIYVDIYNSSNNYCGFIYIII